MVRNTPTHTRMRCETPHFFNVISTLLHTYNSALRDSYGGYIFFTQIGTQTHKGENESHTPHSKSVISVGR